jgi:pseudouridine-5'-phosphate glycosidase
MFHKGGRVDSLISVRFDIAAALAVNAPVVALESTVIAHGLPRPHNLDTALQMEAAVRAAGALPATIAVLDGQLVVGLTEEQIALIAETDDVAKASSSDLAAILASRRTGATTVAATVYIAARAGINIVATGGIGGAHRGSENTFDVSTDLIELARTPVAVVCSGAKVILDLPKTVEILETMGVPVVGYSTNEFPAFYSRESGLALQHRVDTPDEAARLMCVHRDLGGLAQGATSAGMLIVNPPPAEKALPRDQVEALICSAVADAEAGGIRGKSVTPFLLKRLAHDSSGKTLQTNIALLVANAGLAARIAVSYSDRMRNGQ